MFCPSDLKVNVFKQTCLPSNKKLFGRIPEKKLPDIHVIEDDLPVSMNKIESLQFYDEYDSMMQHESFSANDESANRDSENDDSSGES